MDRIKAQADKFWTLLLDPQTYAAYKNFVVTTWAILREAALLVWLVVCLSLVGFEWFWQNSLAAGHNSRAWFNRLEGSNEQIASETGKALLSAGKSSLNFTIATAKQQLGLPAEAVKKE
ncbi:MAG: hypothetical protein NW224_12115 [Leptolyngbyaceae cyanobacterium bins.302]|nr:hypothetical protein [Leptolyngbyaceae cyanobacterium bins.302]